MWVSNFFREIALSEFNTHRLPLHEYLAVCSPAEAVRTTVRGTIIFPVVTRISDHVLPLMHFGKSWVKQELYPLIIAPDNDGWFRFIHTSEPDWTPGNIGSRWKLCRNFKLFGFTFIALPQISIKGRHLLTRHRSAHYTIPCALL